VVYSIIVSTFAMGVIPVNSNCRFSGEIFINACLMARSGDIYLLMVTDSSGVFLSYLLSGTACLWLCMCIAAYVVIFAHIAMFYSVTDTYRFAYRFGSAFST
jgi:hypothetical protein